VQGVTPRTGLAIICTAGVLSACATPPARQPSGAALPASAAPQPSSDASYDWHGLVAPVAFGMQLKNSPVALHEVLLFQGAGRGGAPPGDCYTVDGTAPRFLGRRAEEYLLCFDHDRLVRVEASVHLPTAEAPEAFAHACALWLKNAPLPPSSDLCEGRDGAVSFSGRLGGEGDESAGRVSMTLTTVPEPDPRTDP
jgi:hypothetical protein